MKVQIEGRTGFDDASRLHPSDLFQIVKGENSGNEYLDDTVYMFVRHEGDFIIYCRLERAKI